MNTKHPFTPPPGRDSVVTVYNRRVDISTPAGRRAHQILRQCEIFKDSAHLIDTSPNLDVVLRRVQSYESILVFLSQCSASDLQMCKLSTPQRYSALYKGWLKGKANILNQAVMRSCQAAVDHAKTLKTQKGQANYMDRYFEKNLALSGLLPENIALLKNLQYQWEHSY